MTTVGFIGIGLMGSRQAASLRRAGHDVIVWNRTREKAQAWATQHGGHVAATPRDVAERAEAVITMVVDGAQVEQLLLGDEGAAAGAPPDTLFIDMSTTAPADARRLAAALAERGHAFADAPVSGSLPRAQDGTLTIMVGAETPVLERARPLLEAMGQTIIHAGPPGHGQLVKVISNAVAATNAATLAQALVVGSRAGADLDALVEVLGASAGASLMVTLKGRPMLQHDYTPLFRLEHMLKDVRFALAEAQAAGAPFPFAAEAAELYSDAHARGFGDQDFAAVLEAVEAFAGTRVDAGRGSAPEPSGDRRHAG
jgi:3-hydroxyisobutyrate dehydrogenase